MLLKQTAQNTVKGTRDSWSFFFSPKTSPKNLSVARTMSGLREKRKKPLSYRTNFPLGQLGQGNRYTCDFASFMTKRLFFRDFTSYLEFPWFFMKNVHTTIEKSMFSMFENA